ncbi:MAG: DUF4147 domain-containing protein [Planctomycetaceae bacterium]
MTQASRLRLDAERIWRAGLNAVDSTALVQGVIDRRAETLSICGHDISVDSVRRIAVVGAGKAGAGMAAGFEQAVGPGLLQKVVGWVNVPTDCVRPLEKVHLHAARPAGVNEPTQAGVDGALKILDCVSQLGADDVCIVLLSGGGSALLPAPLPEVGLADKLAVTRLLMQSGASIRELNCVRKHLSLIKGGRLAQATNAGLVITLIISDVVGDPLDVIASGPTVEDHSTAAEALEILSRYAADPDDVPQSVWQALRRAAQNTKGVSALPAKVFNHVIGNNATALHAAAAEARRLGYHVKSLGSEIQGEAAAVGRQLAEMCRAARDDGRPEPPPLCILSGGEPVVHLADTSAPRKGGRNQELVLSALVHLWNDGMRGVGLLSGGTDGEDGPTDAAGAFADDTVVTEARRKRLDPATFLAVHDSYHFFEACGGLLITGPTHTNVMDVRVGLVRATDRPTE